MSKETGVTASMKMPAKAAGALYMRNMANEKLIAKQAEQIKMLREAIDNALRIKDLWQFANVGENYYEEQDLLNGMKSSLEQALSATEHE